MKTEELITALDSVNRKVNQAIGMATAIAHTFPELRDGLIGLGGEIDILISEIEASEYDR